MTLTSNPVTEFIFRFRVAIALVAIVLVFSWAGFHFGDRYGLLIGFFSAMTLNALIFFYVERRISNLFESRELEGVDPDGILRIVREEARRLSVRTPSVHLIKIDTPTAFSAGLFATGAKLYLSRGLIKRLDSSEVALVISYELERLKHEQTQSLTAMSAVASLIATICNAFDAVITFPFTFLSGTQSRELRKYGPLTLITSPIVAGLVRIGSTRGSILKIDKRIGDRIGGNSESWAQTLWKLESYNKTLPLDVNLAEAPLFTVNPLSRMGLYGFASVQPSVETRVRALTGRFPL